MNASHISVTAGLLHDILNHLWQTTAFAVAVAVLTLAFRSTTARTRFWLWMAASLKFLIPFSALVWVGKHLGWSAATPATLQWSFAIDEFSRPFTHPSVVAAAAVPALASFGTERWIAVIWCAGAITVLAHWLVRWGHLRRAIGRMSPVSDDRVLQIATELQGRAGMRKPIRLLMSDCSLEPGVFGVFRPALVLPKGVLDRLTEQQLAAVIDHELCHVRRRDNLAALLHMLVQAVFWFHPLVWWLGARLASERERACDEAVLEQFEEPQAYAQGILKVCEFYLQASMPCVAAVTGADLRKRIEDIMNRRVGKQLDFSRRALLCAVSAAAIAAPVIVGVLDAPRAKAQSKDSLPKQFEVASIKPMEPAMGGMMRVEIQMAPGGRFIAKGLTLRMLIQQAYAVRDFQIAGAPPWATTDRYEINAKAEGGERLGREEIRPMLQALLADRFQLKLRRETKEAPVYELVVAKGGAKLKTSEGEGRDQVRMGRGFVDAQSATMGTVTNQLANQLGRAVIDKTGLTGRYDFKLEWTPDESQNAMAQQMHPDAPPAPPLDNGGPSIFTALQEQLGLKLENAKGPVEVLVIEKVEKPSDN